MDLSRRGQYFYVLDQQLKFKACSELYKIIFLASYTIVFILIYLRTGTQ